MKFDTHSEEFMICVDLFTVNQNIWVNINFITFWGIIILIEKMCFEVNHCQEKHTENPHLCMC